MQLRYEYSWSALIGRRYGPMHELDLFDNEVIVQVSGFINTKILVDYGITPLEHCALEKKLWF